MREFIDRSSWQGLVRRPVGSTRAGIVLVAVLLGASCGIVPRDSAGTLNRVRGGELRVGVAHHPPFVRVTITIVEPRR